MKGVWIDDAFVEDRLVSWTISKVFGVSATFGFVGIVYRDDSQFVERDGDFVDDVAFEKVEGETTYLLLALRVSNFIHEPSTSRVRILSETCDQSKISSMSE